MYNKYNCSYRQYNLVQTPHAFVVFQEVVAMIVIIIIANMIIALIIISAVQPFHLIKNFAISTANTSSVVVFAISLWHTT